MYEQSKRYSSWMHFHGNWYRHPVTVGSKIPLQSVSKLSQSFRFSQLLMLEISIWQSSCPLNSPALFASEKILGRWCFCPTVNINGKKENLIVLVRLSSCAPRQLFDIWRFRQEVEINPMLGSLVNNLKGSYWWNTQNWNSFDFQVIFYSALKSSKVESQSYLDISSIYNL